MTRDDPIRELHELIDALDWRVPRVEQAGEAAIARDAALLKTNAEARLSELLAEQARQGATSSSSKAR